jgi:hypothetical protein
MGGKVNVVCGSQDAVIIDFEDNIEPRLGSPKTESACTAEKIDNRNGGRPLHGRIVTGVRASINRKDGRR